MKELADWKPSDEKDEATYYHQKAIIYQMLVELTEPVFALLRLADGNKPCVGKIYKRLQDLNVRCRPSHSLCCMGCLYVLS